MYESMDQTVSNLTTIILTVLILLSIYYYYLPEKLYYTVLDCWYYQYLSAHLRRNDFALKQPLRGRRQSGAAMVDLAASLQTADYALSAH